MHPLSRVLPLEIEELMAKGMDLSMEPGSATERAPGKPNRGAPQSGRERVAHPLSGPHRPTPPCARCLSRIGVMVSQ